jgi:hypothetical protein
MRRMALTIGAVILLAVGWNPTAEGAEPSPRLRRLLADNPSLALLVRAPALHFQFVSCQVQGNQGWEEDKDTEACRKRIGPQWNDIRAIVEEVFAKNGPAKTYCVDYNKPFVGERAGAPVSGFRCWRWRSDGTFWRGELDYLCVREGAGPRVPPNSCMLTLSGDNEDESSVTTYQFRTAGTGGALKLENDRILVAFKKSK